MYDDVMAELRAYYDREAEQRDADREYPAWKATERQRFLDLMRAAGKRTLLEIGAGPGRDGRFFAQQGLEVVCTDLSTEMVRRCRAKGLTAHQMDFLHLDFPPASFDAVYALNCLLHVPTADLPAVLRTIYALLRPGGLFYVGVYGGIEQEGRPDDADPRSRFFAFHADARMRELLSERFEVASFRAVALPWENSTHFQSFVLRRA